VAFWHLGDRLVVTGQRETNKDEVVTREPFLASVSLANGSVVAWNLATNAPPAPEAAK
jgi:hypothetical protein